MNFVVDENTNFADMKSVFNIMTSADVYINLTEAGGLDNTPDRNAPFVLLTSLPIDVMSYHGKFFREYHNAVQWFFVCSSESGISRLRMAAVKYDLQNCKFFSVNKTPGSLNRILNTISQAKTKKTDKVLICSKNIEYGNLLGKILFSDDTEKYECCEPADDALTTDTDAGKLIICGCSEKDFEDIKLNGDMEPLFVVIEPEKHIQQFLHPEELIEAVSQHFGMTYERTETRFFFISPASEQWLSEDSRPAGLKNLSNGFLMWDDFGLPVSRNEYTEENINNFITKNYLSYHKKLKELIK